MLTGPAKGQVVRLEPMLKEYYSVRKYDWKSGFLIRKELENAGLSNVARELKRRKKLISKR
ncbi:hypothetical protein ES705_19980 [subsurface metagenome]